MIYSRDHYESESTKSLLSCNGMSVIVFSKFGIGGTFLSSSLFLSLMFYLFYYLIKCSSLLYTSSDSYQSLLKLRLSSLSPFLAIYCLGSLSLDLLNLLISPAPPFFSFNFTSILALSFCFFILGQLDFQHLSCQQWKHSFVMVLPQQGQSLVYMSSQLAALPYRILNMYFSLFLLALSYFNYLSILFTYSYISFQFLLSKNP